MNGPNERATLLEKRMTSTADKKTRDLREARSEAFHAYTKANKAFNARWQEVFRETRDTMITEANDD